MRGLPVLAIIVLATVLLPSPYWRRPTDDAIYEGFDASLVYVGDLREPQNTSGARVSKGEAVITATRLSQPVIHLVTTPISFVVRLDVRILESGESSVPFRIGVWSPRTLSGHFVVFESPPKNLVTARTFPRGSLRLDSIENPAVRSVTLGRYSGGLLYRVVVSVDKEAGLVSIRLESNDASPSGGAFLNLVGGPSNIRYSDVASDPISIKGGSEYSLGGTIRAVSGTDSYKISLVWLDARGKFLSFDGDWRSVNELNGWTGREFKARAPSEARHVRVLLGSGNGTQISFSDLYVRHVAKPSLNLLKNGDFRWGTEGWSYVGNPRAELDVIHPSQINWYSSVGRELVPELFPRHRLPLSLTVSSSAQNGAAVVAMNSYVLTLPHQVWQVDKTSDPRATSLLLALWMISAWMVGIGLYRWYASTSGVTRRVLVSASQVTLPPSRFVAVLILAGMFLFANTLLYGLGSLPFDMLGAKIWAYVSMKYGPTALYHLPNTVSLARVWAGAPYHEAIFPYGPTMGYLFALAGWTYRLFFSGPAAPVADAFQLEFVIKSLNSLFGLASAVMIYLIRRAQAPTARERLFLAGLFLLNPALIFSMSIWGQTQTWSLFFALVAVWATQGGYLPLAWFSLAITALTRPQLLVIVFLLTVMLLRRWPWRKNLQALSWAILGVFLLFAPFLIKLGPHFPIDYLKSQFLFQAGGGNEPELTTVSLDAYSLWPLVTAAANDAIGLARFSFRSGLPMILGLTYGQVGNAMTVLLVSSVAILLVGRGKRISSEDCQLFLAFGIVGFLMLQPGIAGAHFVIALPFIVLCHRTIPRAIFAAIVGGWTLTTTVAIYGSFGFGVLNVPWLAPSLHSSSNDLTRFMMALHSSDWFITVGSLANLSVLLALGYFVAQGRRSSRLSASP